MPNKQTDQEIMISEQQIFVIFEEKIDFRGRKEEGKR